MEHTAFQRLLVEATDHLRAALIRKTRTDRIDGWAGLCPYWPAPSYIAAGSIGHVSLEDLTRIYYSVERGIIGPAEVQDTWSQFLRALRTRESAPATLTNAMANQLPGIELATQPHQKALSMLAEYSAVMSMVVGRFSFTATTCCMDLGHVKLEIKVNRIYMGRFDGYISRLSPLWGTPHLVDTPCGKRKRANRGLTLVVKFLSHEFPEMAQRLLWLARLALYTGNEGLITRGFDVQNVNGDEDTTETILDAVIRKAQRHEAIDIKALSQVLVPEYLTNPQFSELVCGTPRVESVLSGSTRHMFIQQAQALRQRTLDPNFARANEILEIERKLKKV